ncbi:serine/threonine-protein kinase 31 isoform X1 [Crotalus tigris]|uniref:serine/threonine-protein kinase 31 isoform X1 n=2 Tax=Crotalus tigris TaxID=88082 RepID=UPI00192F1F43|nr:serine/threonine-protein kinase 31 isoform X1 [Crotalus tigris]XP_039198022.1 serine/threonine-protein kinase 31 isoform X1 [Crotalus tigris]
MEEDSTYNKVEIAVGCHVEDAVTFWAQNINKSQEILKISSGLAEICPQAIPVFGNPDFNKIYGGCFSEDKCWYRCKVLKIISDEKCQVLYIDYGNSEVLRRSEIVGITENLQFPGVAKKYKLWGLQLSANIDLNQFDRGRIFLNSLIFEKEIKITHKAMHRDGTIIAQAECGLLDVGEEMAKKGFAELRKSSIKNKFFETKVDFFVHKNAKISTPRWAMNSVASSRMTGSHGDMFLSEKNENSIDHSSSIQRISDISLEKIREDQKLIEETEKLKEEMVTFQKENQILSHQCEIQESTIHKLTCDLENEKKAYKESLDCMENRLLTYVGTTVRKLATRFETLKETRQNHASAHFGEDLLEAANIVTKEKILALQSMEKLEKIWTDYNISQQEIRLCKHVDEVQSLILQRNELQHKLPKALEEFIVEVNDLPLSERLETLKKLQGSLEVAYGQADEAEGSEEVFEEFFEWKNARLEKFSWVRNATDTSLQNLVLSFSNIIQFFDTGSTVLMKSEDVGVNVDEVLKNVELDISQEFDMFLTELDEKDKKVILNMYNVVMRKILQEQDLINAVNQKYLESCEFKNQIVEWLDMTPNIDDLLLIKKRMKDVKAQLRWKLVEKNNLEESDNYSKDEMVKIKEEISSLQDNVFQEIYKEQEEYEKLNHLVQKRFPELPLLHPEVGILKYMNSGGLTVSLERDLLNAEPMKELSIKHPVMCSTIQGQKVLLKGYIVDMNIETQIIERAAKYHKVWKELREESCLMQPMFLFLCKSDPMVYLMIPYYAGANLGTLQMTAPLTPQETLKVMKGVARGLCALHKADIIHGSLHKNNVFALNREQGIVGDFDFTKSESKRALSDFMTLNGLSLISPELRNGQPPSPASDMYVFGCLLYWLFIGKQELKTNEDGTPEIDGLDMDDKVKSLLSQLLCYDNRMTAEQVLNADCFLSPDLISVPLESEVTEYDHGEQSPEDVSDESLDDKSEPSSDKDPDAYMSDQNASSQ